MQPACPSTQYDQESLGALLAYKTVYISNFWHIQG